MAQIVYLETTSPFADSLRRSTTRHTVSNAPNIPTNAPLERISPSAPTISRTDNPNTSVNATWPSRVPKCRRGLSM